MTERGFAAELAQDLDPEDLRMVLEVFRRDVVRLTGMLHENAAAADVTAFLRTCHALAGAAGTVGAAALERGCRDVMHLSDLAPAQLPAIAAGIHSLGVAAQGQLDAFLATLPPTG